MLSNFIVNEKLNIPSGSDNYNYVMIEDIISRVTSQNRVFYLEFELELEGLQEMEIQLIQPKLPSYDYNTSSSENKESQAYEMVTRLGSNLIFESQTATLSHVESIEIVKSNMGFNLEEGVTSVLLGDDEHYFIHIKPK